MNPASTAGAARRLAVSLGVVLVVGVAAGCRTAAPGLPGAVAAAAASPQPATRIIERQSADGARSAIVHHPATAGPQAPLVVVLHPAGTSAATAQANLGWDALADRDGFVVAYPEGVLDGFQDTWNGGTCCPPASELKSDDVGFLDQLVADLRRLDGVGPRVYAVGFSNGAMMAYAWACARPGELAGIGVVAGAQMADCPSPGPLTVVAVHGAADDQIPLDGGPAPDEKTFPALPATLARFRRAARCSAAPVTTELASAQVTAWSCRAGRRVVLDVVRGLGHAWPGAGPQAGTSAGPQDATGFVWAQLRAGS